jgi:hypothetical protein
MSAVNAGREYRLTQGRAEAKMPAVADMASGAASGDA